MQVQSHMHASQRGAFDSVANFQILLTPRMFLVWDFLVGIFALKAMRTMGQVLLTISC